MATGKVVAIFICPEKGKPMQAVQEVRAIAGVGLEGDRYATGKGTYSGLPNRSDKSKSNRQVTLISESLFDEANMLLDVPYTLIETRRNIVINGDIDVVSLVGKEFSVGPVRIRGFEDCTPCKIPEKMSGKPGFERAFKNAGGLRAEILTDGLIRIGDELTQ
jgi:MOSC domain-containing protein YiiM